LLAGSIDIRYRTSARQLSSSSCRKAAVPESPLWMSAPPRRYHPRRADLAVKDAAVAVQGRHTLLDPGSAAVVDPDDRRPARQRGSLALPALALCVATGVRRRVKPVTFGTQRVHRTDTRMPVLAEIGSQRTHLGTWL
jgi:hypothetical protein